MPANSGGCAQMRIYSPMKKLAEMYPDRVEIRWNENPLGFDPETKTHKYMDQKNPEGYSGEIPDIDWCDILFSQAISNFGGPYSLTCIVQAKNRGKKVHWDTDDLLTDIYEKHRLKKVYVENGLEELAKIMYATADLCSVTQSKFADRVAPYALSNNGSLVIIKNALDYNLPAWNMPKVPPPHKNMCRFGWVGGIHHEVDLQPIKGVAHTVNQRVGIENVYWELFGKPPIQKKEDEWQLDVWKNYEKLWSYGMRGNRKNYKIHPALAFDNFGKFYSIFDVALAPLDNNDFNDSKSECKLMEAARYGVPLIASDVGCYNEVIKNWENGVLLSPDASKSDWVKVLVKVAKNKKLRETMGVNIKEYCDEHYDLNKLIKYRMSLYEALMGWESDMLDAMNQAKLLNQGPKK